jgi:hypothetical protein
MSAWMMFQLRSLAVEMKLRMTAKSSAPSFVGETVPEFGWAEGVQGASERSPEIIGGELRPRNDGQPVTTN